MKTCATSFPIREHLIYVTLAVVALLLTHAGAYWALAALFVYPLRFPRLYPYFLVAAGLIFGAFLWGSRPLPPPMLNGPQQLELSIKRVRRQIEGRQTAVATLDGMDVYLTYLEDSPRLLPGDQILVQGDLGVPGAVRVPHAFDFAAFLRSHNIGQTLFAREIEVVGQRFSLWRYQHLASDWVAERLPPLTAAYVQALFLGRRDGMEAEMQDALSDLGLIHVFAISGMHVGLLGGLLAYALKRLGVLEEIAQYLVFLFLAAFIFLAGGSPSILRAAGMGMLAIMNRSLKWGLSSLDIFSLVFLANVAIAPRQIGQTGFLYSYWASFLLLMGRTILGRMPRWRLFFFLPFYAQLGTLPLTLYFNYEINIWAYVANVLLAPLVGALLIPLLLAALILPGISQLSEPILQHFQQLGLWLSRAFSRFFVSGALGVSTTLFLLILFLAACWLFEKYRRGWLWAAALLAMVGTVEAVRLPGGSRLTFVDVGQGDAMVIQSPLQACTVVVDTGGQFFSGGAKRPIFHQTLEPFLLGEGVRRVDYLILTHGHFDHIGEARELMDRFEVGHVVVPEAVQEGYFEVVLDHAQSLGIPVISAGPMDTLRCGNQSYVFLQPRRPAKDENDVSLVMVLEMEGVRSLLTGDIGFDVEPYILAALDGGVDIYKSAHHGSRYSNSAEFMGALSPQVAVVQAGVTNRFNHPTPEWYQVVDALGIPQFDTPSYGTVQIHKKTGSFRVTTALQP